MARRHAIDIAMDGASKPELLALLAVGPLPDGVKSLLRIVAEGEWRDAETEHAYRRHRPDAVRAASAAFLTTVLFDKRSDPYRVLGLAQGASMEDVRENKRLLLKWLHPDRNPRPAERAHLARVIEAAESIEGGTAPRWGSRQGTNWSGRPAPKPSPDTSARGTAATAGKPARPARASKAPGRVKPAATQLVGGLFRTARFATLSAVVLLTGLATWRYVMEEPIGVSLARYSKLAMGFVPW